MNPRAAVGGGVAVGLAAVVGGLVGHAPHAAVGAAIVVAAIVALLVVRDLAKSVGVSAASGTVTRTGELGQLRALDRAVEAAVGSPIAFDRELRPLLRSIATTKLARRGIDAELRPADAEAILGEELWGWIRGGSAALSPARSPAAATARLQAMIERLERI